MRGDAVPGLPDFRFVEMIGTVARTVVFLVHDL